MTEPLFNKIDYKTSSWALWSEDTTNNADLKSFFMSRICDLKSNIIFLGLNPSNKIEPYSNFHTPMNKGVRFLSENIKNYENLHGGFMTDLSEKVAKKENMVNIELTNINNLIENIKLLNRKKYTIICFGDKVYNSIKKALDIEVEIHLIKFHILKFSTEIEKNISIEVFRIWHYSNYGKYEPKIKELKEQLNYINKQISFQNDK